MLRITVQDAEGAAAFKLEGKLAYEWVAEAEKAWIEFSGLARKANMVVDLCGVSFVDEAGRELLSRMHDSGAKLIGAGPMSSALIEEICGKSPRSARKWMRGVLGLFFLLAAIAMPGNDSARTLLENGLVKHVLCQLPGCRLNLHNYANALWKGRLQ